MINLCNRLNTVIDNYCILGPFMGRTNLPDNFIDTGWIETEKMKYYYWSRQSNRRIYKFI